ncbi:hypothetical protein ACFC1N_37955, partial [Streptomyces sp. NPDC056132]
MTPAPITLVLPDGQTIERVRLYERAQLDDGAWVYRIGVPLWQTALGGGAEPVEYSTWVTAGQYLFLKVSTVSDRLRIRTVLRSVEREGLDGLG